MLSLLKINHLKILKSPSIWISLIFVVFFMAFSPKAMSSTAAPSVSESISISVASAIVITGLLITVITTFGESFVKIKGSLIYQNIQLNNKPRYQFFVATIIPVIVYSTIMFILSMVIMIIFDSAGLLNANKSIIDWANVQYLYLILSLVTTITLGVSISLLISTLSKTDNTYTALTWAYIFLVFFFGGSSVPIFLIRGDSNLDAFMYLSFIIPNSFSNFLFVDSMVGNVGPGEYTYYLDVFLPMVLSMIFIGTRYAIMGLQRK